MTSDSHALNSIFSFSKDEANKTVFSFVMKSGQTRLATGQHTEFQPCPTVGSLCDHFKKKKKPSFVSLASMGLEQSLSC